MLVWCNPKIGQVNKIANEQKKRYKNGMVNRLLLDWFYTTFVSYVDHLIFYK